MKPLIKPLTTLFHDWLETDIEPTPETTKAYEKFQPEGDVGNWETWELLANAIVSEQEKAFKAGFRIAVQMLMNSAE